MRILLWGNHLGVQGYLEALGKDELVGVVAAANRPDDLKRVARLAQSAELPLLVQPYRRDAQSFRRFENAVRTAAADLFVVNAYSMLLNNDWLAWPTVAALNVHAGLLPEYRGANVINWALVNGERKSGVTIHHLDAGIDTGDLVLQRPIEIQFEDTAVSLRDKLLNLIGPMLRVVISQARSGTLPRMPQDARRARHWPRRRAEDGRIDFSWTTPRIYNLIRALVAPWPGAFYVDRLGRQVVIDRFMPIDEVRTLQQTFREHHAPIDRCDTPA